MVEHPPAAARSLSPSLFRAGLALLLTSLGVSPALGQQLRTASEASGFSRHTTYAEMMEYLIALEKSSLDMRLSTYGETREGRELPYAILSRPMVTQPWEAASLGRPIVLLAANVPGFSERVELGPLVAAQLDGTQVVVGNDVSVGVLGEYRRGAGRPFGNLLGVWVGTGVGGGLILDGELHDGRGAGGEIGHMVVEPGGLRCPCGRRGCLEAYAGNLGPRFPNGLFVCQDGPNDAPGSAGNQNFKFVPFDRIVAA